MREIDHTKLATEDSAVLASTFPPSMVAGWFLLNGIGKENERGSRGDWESMRVIDRGLMESEWDGSTE